MPHKKFLEPLNITFKDLGDQSLMGGVAGDFRHTLPMIRRPTPSHELNACLKRSGLWRSVNKFSLITNMRIHLRGEIGAGCPGVVNFICNCLICYELKK